MRLLIIGHSYVSELSNSGLKSFDTEGELVTVRYICRSGGTYDKFLTEPGLFERIENEEKPDYILVILAGNSISNNTTNEEIHSSARAFYNRLRESFPDSKMIATQAEKRFYKPGNRWNCPTETEYTRRRDQFNRFLLKATFKDHILMIAGTGRLDNRYYYKTDGVHLNSQGLQFLIQTIMSLMNYLIMSKRTS